MANYATLKAAIQQVVKTNGNNEITGALLQQSLLAMINSLGAGFQYSGIATPSTNPGTPDQNVFYLASTAGTYTNFGGIVLGDNEAAILRYNGTWTKDTGGFATQQMVNTLTQLSFPYFTGNNNSFAKNDWVYPVKAGRTYRLIPFVREWEHSAFTASANVFGAGYVVGTTETYLLTLGSSWSNLRDYYDITMPSNLPDNAFLAIGGRANLGVRVYFILQDITESVLADQKIDALKMHLSFTGADNTFARSSKNTISVLPGHVYRFTPNVKEWAHNNVTSTATANGTAIGYFANNTETFLYASVVGAWEFLDYYDIKIPDNVTGAVARVGGRANSGVVVEFTVEDITEISDIKREIFAPIVEGSGVLVSMNNTAIIECNLISGQEYVFSREFSGSIMNLNAGSAGSSGMRVFLSNTASVSGATIQNIEQILYQNGAIFQRSIKFTASANARYLIFFVNAKAADAGKTFNFGVGKEVGESILSLNNSVKNLSQNVDLGRTSTLTTEGVSTNTLVYFKPLGGYPYLFTFENFTKSLLSSLKVQIGYYPNENDLSDSAFVLLRQINNSADGDVDVSQFKDLVYTFPDNSVGRIVIRGDAGQTVHYRIDNVKFQDEEFYGIKYEYIGQKLTPYGHKNNYKEKIIPVPGISVYDGLSLQGFAIYGKYAFMTYDTGYIRILDLDTMQIIATYAMPSGVQNPQNHAGMANFGYVFYDATDDFPLLYVSSYLENKCYVLRVTLSSCSLVQTIQMSNSWHYLVDDFGHLIVHMNDWNTYYIFNVPDVNTPNVTLQAADAIDTFQFVTPGMYTTGTFCQDGKMYILCYYIGRVENGKYDRLVVYNYEKKQVVSTIIFEDPQIRTHEFEGMSVTNDGNILISFNGYNTLAELAF